MRLPSLALPLMFMGAPAALAAPQPTGTMPVVAPGTKADCPKTTAYWAMKKRNSPAVQKLTDLPPANHYLSVYRRIDGCEVPVIAGYGIGARDNRRASRR